MSLTVGAMLVSAATLGATPDPGPSSAASVARLVNHLDRAVDGVVAVEFPQNSGRFVAARRRRGELLVLTGRCEAVESLRRLLRQGARRALFDTLQTCAVPSTKILVHDADANGLRPNLGRNAAPDVVDELASRRLVLDGDWATHELDREAYTKACARLDAKYRGLVEALLAGLPR